MMAFLLAFLPSCKSEKESDSEKSKRTMKEEYDKRQKDVDKMIEEENADITERARQK